MAQLNDVDSSSLTGCSEYSRVRGRRVRARGFCLASLLLVGNLGGALLARPGSVWASIGGPWILHVVDDSSSGADGVRLADIDGNGLPDLVTGWEEGGVTRIYLNPGNSMVRSRWPSVTVGRTPSVEDAVFFDIDGDGNAEVVSSCEGDVRTMYVHWPPEERDRLLIEEAWTTEQIPATQDRTQWMFALPLQVDGRKGIDLVVGSKGDDGMIGWLESPVDPHNLQEWVLHPIYKAGWIMSLVSADLDQDGDNDVITSDRKGENSGVLWLENPGEGGLDEEWNKHRIGADGREVMFLTLNDLDGDRRQDIVVAVKPNEVLCFFQPETPTHNWPSQTILVDFPKGIGGAKAVEAGDLDLDGRIDLVFSCESAEHPRRGIVWLSPPEASDGTTWITHDLSGERGIKYDRMELVDLDGDGDLDVLTCEENEGEESRGLGVIWYENPHVSETSD